MKIIHTADIHLGSPLSKISDNEKRIIRKNEILNSFDKLINYAKQNEIKIIMMSGDIFDNNSPYKKDKNYFYHLIKTNPDITFLYLKGNHDINNEYNEEYPNLLTFSDDWKSYEFENVRITGVELKKENSKSIYPSLNLKNDKINIVMMHGDIYNKGENYISLKDLKNKNIDYLALGHIHENIIDKLDDKGIYSYSGCLEGRGYDEVGPKGFYVLNIENNKIDYEFIINSKRIIHSIDVDISNAYDFATAKDLIYEKTKTIKKEDIVRINLEGINQIEDDLEELENYFSFFYFSIKNNTKRKIDYKKYENDLSLKGEFVRCVLANKELTEDEKNEIIFLGLKSLNEGVVC